LNLLLDTQCLLWWFTAPEQLNSKAIEQIVDSDNELFFSVASVWEIAIKVGIGKLPLPEPVDTYVASRMQLLGAKYLDIVFPHACRVATLPLLHRDPFVGGASPLGESHPGGTSTNRAHDIGNSG
jgi:PIN domain nuclease of toxin-antitoxin system